MYYNSLPTDEYMHRGVLQMGVESVIFRAKRVQREAYTADPTRPTHREHLKTSRPPDLPCRRCECTGCMPHYVAHRRVFYGFKSPQCSVVEHYSLGDGGDVEL